MDKHTDLVNQYILSLSPNEKKAYEIAKSHLESSFDVEKSIGFKKFKEKLANHSSSSPTATTTTTPGS